MVVCAAQRLNNAVCRAVALQAARCLAGSLLFACGATFAAEQVLDRHDKPRTHEPESIVEAERAPPPCLFFYTSWSQPDCCNAL